jgi:hypothetical protein
MEDRRIRQPHVERNRDVIMQAIDERLPRDGRVLEVASGTGQHAWYFAKNRPLWDWQPSEPTAERCERADAWLQAEPLTNLRPATPLDVVDAWQLEHREFDLVFNANMIHISPWATCQGLMRGASAHLRDDGHLMIYGPFKVDGRHTAPSNAAFDESLRSRDESWGIRDLEAVVERAAQSDLRLLERIAMPANNLTLVFARA